jgi:very-short-patch-repair endonuclease
MEGQTRKRIHTDQRQRTLRRNSTDSEPGLWRYPRGRQIDGAKFRRQHPFGDGILDFACIERKLVVQLDAGQHAQSTKYDDWRTRQLEQAGFAVLRFWNHDVLENRGGVLKVILAALRERAKPILTQPSP